MSRRLRRPAAALAAVTLLPVLASCGSSNSSSDPASSSTSSSAAGGSSSPTPSDGASSAAALTGVSFTGDVGKSLDASWQSTIAPATSTTVSTVVKGTGPAIADGDTVSAYLWVGDGTTKKVAYSDYTQGTPEQIPFSSQLSPLFSQLLTGATYGSRVAAVTTPAELLGGSSGSSLGIGANDSVVIVADLVSKAPTSPTPSDAAAHDVAPSKLPKVVVKQGKPVGLDWKGIAKPSPSTPVQRAILKQGTGPVVTTSDTVTVNYLGEIYQAKKAFDESYTSSPLTQPLSGLIPGWSIGLTGVKVGSRVLLQIPPADAYGAAGSGSTIPGNSTLWFVIDVVKAQ